MPNASRYLVAALLALLVIPAACSTGSKKHSSSTAAQTTTTASPTSSTASTASSPATTKPSATATTVLPPISSVPLHPTTTRKPPVIRGSAITIEPGGVINPASYTARPNSPVFVTNADNATHTLVADDGSFQVGPMAKNVQYSFLAPLAVGSHPFHLADEPSVRGTLVVSTS